MLHSIEAFGLKHEKCTETDKPLSISWLPAWIPGSAGKVICYRESLRDVSPCLCASEQARVHSFRARVHAFRLLQRYTLKFFFCAMIHVRTQVLLLWLLTKDLFVVKNVCARVRYPCGYLQRIFFSCNSICAHKLFLIGAVEKFLVLQFILCVFQLARIFLVGAERESELQWCVNVHARIFGSVVPHRTSHLLRIRQNFPQEMTNHQTNDQAIICR